MIFLLFTFKGGTRLAEYKITRNTPIEKMTPPAEIFLPMSQNTVPTVKIGERVLRGQIIAETEDRNDCPIHSGVSGKVKSIISKNKKSKTGCVVVIENDGEYETAPDIIPSEKKLTETTSEEIIEVVRKAGIEGFCRDDQPAYAKIQSALGRADKLIINCVESDPYITSAYRLMLERPAEIVNGTKILLKALGLREADIAVEDNKIDAAEKLEEKIGSSRMINVKIVKSKYPQADDRQLVYALTGREIPAGKSPLDVRCVVFSAQTCAAIYRAFAFGAPLTERLVTVSGGCVAAPKNLIVTLGTTYKDVIDYCSGLKKEPRKIINGGAMTGVAVTDINVPVLKGTSAILVLSADECAEEETDAVCIRCGKCVMSCPMHLMPTLLADLARNERLDEAEKNNLFSCVECGSCTYVCPAKIHLAWHIRVAKEAIRAK